MYRPFLLWLSLLLATLTACQPIRPEISPETELTPVVVDSVTTTMTETAPITDSAAITTTGDVTPTSEVTKTSSTRPSAAGASCPVVAGEIPQVSILANWQEGEQRHYSIHKTRTDSVGGVESVSLDTTDFVTITVIGVALDGYQLAWQYSTTESAEPQTEAINPLEATFALPSQLVMKYATEGNGAFVEVTNIEDLQEGMIAIFDQIFEELQESGEFDEAIIEGSRQQAAQMFGDAASFYALFAQEVQLFHTLHGFAFESAEPLVIADVRPNILGGGPIPSELTVTPTNYDADLGCLHVDFANIADPVETRNSVLTALQEQARQLGIAGPTDANFPPEVELEDHIRFEFEITSGWPTAIYSERIITIATQGRVETTEIVLVEPE